MGNTIPDYTPKKQCSKCRNWLPFSSFSADRNKLGGLNCHCRKCKVISQRQSRTPERSRRYMLRSLYGITPSQYDRMFAEQCGVCAICKQPETHPDSHSKTGEPRLLSVDHDHETGDARKLLCSGCNVALGRMNEDPERIRALADYAEWCQTREPSRKIIQLPLI